MYISLDNFYIKDFYTPYAPLPYVLQTVFPYKNPEKSCSIELEIIQNQKKDVAANTTIIMNTYG